MGSISCWGAWWRTCLGSLDIPVFWNYFVGEPPRFLGLLCMGLPSLAGVKPAKKGSMSPPLFRALSIPWHFEATNWLFGQ